MQVWLECKAFPDELSEEVASIIPSIAQGQWHPPSSVSFLVTVQGKGVEIPRRVYYNADRVREQAMREGVAGRVALCLGTAHHDGYLRQECAERLLRSDEPWIAPFIVSLVGQYVVEIISVIERALPCLDAQMYGDFLFENSHWLKTIERRVISYWDAYYRVDFPEFSEYPGARLMHALWSYVGRSNPSFQRTASPPLT